jgi:hypothetical protein
LLGDGVSARRTGTFGGTVVDEQGDAIAGATVTISRPGFSKRRTVTNDEGKFTFRGLPAGKYVIRISAPGFNGYRRSSVQINEGKRKRLRAQLSVKEVRENVVVNTRQLGTERESSASMTTLREKDLNVLPDDPNGMESALTALAGGLGSDAEITVDGISGARIPPRSSIREIRINRSPFSAENDRMGFGGIEIFTKSGTDRLRGQSNFIFNDARMNARSPYSLTRTPGQTRLFNASLSGPIKKNRSSFYLDFSHGSVDQTSVVNATVLDGSLNIVPFRQNISTPNRSLSISPRVDVQLGKNNTLVARYGFYMSRSEDQGVSDLSLPSRAFRFSSTGHELFVTETAVINHKTVTETKVGYFVNSRRTEGDSSTPTVLVAGAFVGGGSSIGLNLANTHRLELQNYTTTMLGKNERHAVKFGIRFRSVGVDDRSEANFGGMFVFAGVRDPQNGNLLYSSIEQYRQKLLGNTDPRFNPNQFVIAHGDPFARISQHDMGLFVMDDWRLRQNLTVGIGLRYENQNNIRDRRNFAPRLGIAWSPDGGGKGPVRTVIRAGLGVFYTRINENFFLQAKRLDGTRQTQYIVGANDPLLNQPVFTLDGVSGVPTIEQLAGHASSSVVATRQVSADLRSPVNYQAAISIDRQLPMRTTISVSYLANRGRNLMGSVNINAPICPPSSPCNDDAPRPDPTHGNVFEYRSLGVTTQHQLLINFNSNAIRRFTFGGNYRLGHAMGDIDGFGNYPLYSYDLHGEFGPSSLDIRHNFNFYGTLRLPWNIQLSPFVNISSGAPYNITTGTDSNRDSIFNDRPTFRQLNDVCVQRGLTNGFCGIAANHVSDAIIPRNLGRGPMSSFFNLNIDRSIVLAGRKDGPVSLNLGVQMTNLLNHVNRAAPIGNLSSDRFGQTYSGISSYGGDSGGSRRVQIVVRFSF